MMKPTSFILPNSAADSISEISVNHKGLISEIYTSLAPSQKPLSINMIDDDDDWKGALKQVSDTAEALQSDTAITHMFWSCPSLQDYRTTIFTHQSEALDMVLGPCAEITRPSKNQK